MAQHMLRRWRWQLAGHMHVLGCPSYMEDHCGALEEDIQAGLVPLPQLPKHKQVRLWGEMQIVAVCSCLGCAASAGVIGVKRQLVLWLLVVAGAGHLLPPGSIVLGRGSITCTCWAAPPTWRITQGH
jgi:hypothetical protein